MNKKHQKLPGQAKERRDLRFPLVIVVDVLIICQFEVLYGVNMFNLCTPSKITSGRPSDCTEHQYARNFRFLSVLFCVLRLFMGLGTLYLIRCLFNSSIYRILLTFSSMFRKYIETESVTLLTAIIIYTEYCSRL